MTTLWFSGYICMYGTRKVVMIAIKLLSIRIILLEIVHLLMTLPKKATLLLSRTKKSLRGRE